MDGRLEYRLRLFVLFEHREILYPKYMRHGEIRKGFTAYIKDTWIEKWKNPKR